MSRGSPREPAPPGPICYIPLAMRFTLTAKLLLAFSALALLAALPGAGLLYGILRLERTTHESFRGVETRDACGQVRAEALAALTALQSEALFPEDPRFKRAAEEHLVEVERSVAEVREGLDDVAADALENLRADFHAAAEIYLGDPTATRPRQRLQAATLALITQIDRTGAEINAELARRDAAVAADVDRLSHIGELGLVSMVVAALLLALGLGAAFRRRMVSLGSGVERIARGDLAVRIDDGTSDEIGALARTFNHMAGELQLLEDMKSQFVAVASHELRTPLTLIDGYCGILLSPAKGPLSDWNRERVERIHAQVQELLGLVADLLDAERLQERAFAPVLEPFEPEALVTGLYRDFESEARARGLTLELVVAPGAPTQGHADVRALTRVIRNLLDNALKYTAAGQVTFTLGGDRERLLISVADTGCGIPAEELPRIFQRFYQVKAQGAQAGGRPRKGFGLGLAIVRGLVERNRGTIEAHSEPGKGSTFEVRWPVAQSQQAPPVYEERRSVG